MRTENGAIQSRQRHSNNHTSSHNKHQSTMTDRSPGPADAGAPRKEIYTYKAPWTVFSMAWSHRTDPSSQFRLAIGSYVEQYSNAVQIVKKANSTGGSNADAGGSSSGGGFGNQQLYAACEFDHPYPCTKILWSPDTRNAGGKDLLATTGDYLRVWNLEDDGTGRGTMTPKRDALLNNVSNLC